MFRLRVLGGAALEQDGATLDTMGAQRKSLALLTLLAVSRSNGISRERLTALLWPESDTERARGALKQALHVVRRQLGSLDIIQGTAELRLNPAHIQSDVDAFLSALEGGRLHEAVALYGGPFLDGFHLPGSPEFEHWVAAQRDDLARRYAATLERLASGAEAGGDPHQAIEWLRRLQGADPLSVQPTLRLMHALDAVGERAAAIRCAQAHEALFRDELDSPPDPEVAALAERFRQEAPRARSLLERAGRPAPLAAASAAAHETVPTETRKPRPGPIRVAIAFVVLCAIILAAALYVTGRRGAGGSAPGAVSTDRSVAVLPFVNADGDSTSDYLSDGLTDGLTGALSRVEGLRVAPRAATAAAQRQGFGLRAIADSLGVATVIEGSVRHEGDRLQVTARVVRALDSMVLWSAGYDHGLHELLAVQEEIARSVISTLHPSGAADSAMAADSRRTAHAEAYDVFLRGRHAWRQRTREGLEQAVVFYEEAVERDPTFAMAYAGLADAYINLSNFAIREPGEAIARAEVAADRALELDPQLAEGYASKGFVLASRGDFRASERTFQRAMALSPGYTWAHHYYTLLLLMLDRTDEALEHNRHALAADPLSVPANATRGIILCQRGDLEGAERELQRALALSPSAPLVLYYLGVVHAARGDYENAGQLLERAARGAPGFTGMPGARILVYQQTGRQQAADSLLAHVEAEAASGEVRDSVNMAFAYAVLGRVDAAFSLFEQVRWDVPSLIELRADPLLQSLRTDPRYPPLLQQIERADRSPS